MRANDLVQKVVNIARNYKTLYVYACFGAPMTNSNKNRYMGGQAIYEFNRRADRAAKIRNASSNTFGFDCVNLIKGVLWGWNGNVNHIYGGAVYGSNGVPDTNANGMFWDYCYNQSSNFSNIIPGEFVWMEGHIGIYIGGGLAVECTPIWADGVQITAVGNIGSKAGYATRTWTSHGKSKFVDYSGSPSPAPQPTPKPTPGPSDKFNIGDRVVVNGPLYANSNAVSPSGSVSNKTTNITRKNPGSAHPYNTTGDLGWMDESSIRKAEEPKPQPTPQPAPQPTPELKYHVGQEVVVNGQLYGTSNGDNPGSVVSNVETTITRALVGKPFPYNTTGDLGWVAEGSISPKQAPAPQKDDLLELVKRTIRGDFGNGDERRAALGDRYDEVQHQVQMNIDHGLTRWDNIRLF